MGIPYPGFLWYFYRMQVVSVSNHHLVSMCIQMSFDVLLAKVSHSLYLQTLRFPSDMTDNE